MRDDVGLQSKSVAMLPLESLTLLFKAPGLLEKHDENFCFRLEVIDL